MSRPLVLSGLQISETLDRLMIGRIHVGQVPLQLMEWYWAGTAEPCTAHAAEIESLQTDLNYWYWRAVDPEAHARRMRDIITAFDVEAARNAVAARWAALNKAESDRQAALDASKGVQ